MRGLWNTRLKKTQYEKEKKKERVEKKKENQTRKAKEKGGGKKSRTLRARSLEDKRSPHQIKNLEAL